MAGDSDLRLAATWIVVELETGRGPYSSRMTEVARVSTELWAWLSNYPKLDDAYSARGKSKVLVRERDNEPERRFALEALSVFRDGISAEWEHPLNRSGYEVRLKLDPSSLPRHEFWEEVLLLLVGESLPQAAALNGLRFVDKGKGKHRLEIWLREQPQEALVQALRAAFTDAVGQTCPKLETVRHADFVVQ